MAEKGRINVVFIFTRLHEEHNAEGKMLCVNCKPEITFDRVPKNVLECAMKKGIPKVLVRSVMSP